MHHVLQVLQFLRTGVRGRSEKDPETVMAGYERAKPTWLTNNCDHMMHPRNAASMWKKFLTSVYSDRMGILSQQPSRVSCLSIRR